MEHLDDAPLAEDDERGAVPDDGPVGGPAGPGDENMADRPLTPGHGEDGPREPSPDDRRPD